MCGRSAISERARIEEKFAINRVGQYDVINRDVSPGDQIPIVVQVDEERVLSSGRWGLNANNRLVYNCRSEGLLYQWSHLLGQRAIVPMDSFVEHGLPGGVTFEAVDGGILSAAALYEIYPKIGGGYGRRVGVLTSFATEPILAYHHRQPVLLDDDHISAWLDPAERSPQLLTYLQPVPVVRVPTRNKESVLQ